MPWLLAADAEQLGDNDVRGYHLGGQDIAVARINGQWFAFNDICSHQVAFLSDGFVEDGCIECPMHQGRFDIRTGQPLCAPVTEPIATYPVKLQNGQVWVEIQA